MAQADILPFPGATQPPQMPACATELDFQFVLPASGDKFALSPQIKVCILPYGQPSRLYLRRRVAEGKETCLVAELGSMRVEITHNEMVFASRTAYGVVRDGFITRCEGGMAGGQIRNVIFFTDGEVKCYFFNDHLVITTQDLKL
jgi:hypothetical protein